MSRGNGEDVSPGKFWFIIGLVAFLFVTIDVRSMILTDEEMAEANNVLTLVNLVGFWGGGAAMIWGPGSGGKSVAWPAVSPAKRSMRNNNSVRTLSLSAPSRG
jgi:hypothetical protein